MSINMKFAPDLVLANFSEYKKGQKKISLRQPGRHPSTLLRMTGGDDGGFDPQKEECIPQDLQENQTYDFLKTGQRAYWLEGEQPLLEKTEDGKVSIPKASVIILETTHFMNKDKTYTKGKYKVVKIIDKNEIYFNGCEPIKK